MKDEILLKALDDLVETTTKRDLYEVEYETEKARMLQSAEVQAFGNQATRDSQVTILMDEKGMYTEMAKVRSLARVAYYKWATFKAIRENKQ